MSTRNVLGYCPNCRQNVLLVREAINWPLAIILLIFTGGIGLIIYLIIYFNQARSRCIHCHSLIPLKSNNAIQTPSPIQTGNQLRQESEITTGDTAKDVKTQRQQFCSFCGERLISKDANFCPYCGTKI
jgi:predicted RNA-binding Zn-ribbon protein involved in translation (DUF1610 family)